MFFKARLLKYNSPESRPSARSRHGGADRHGSGTDDTDPALSRSRHACGDASAARDDSDDSNVRLSECVPGPSRLGLDPRAGSHTRSRRVLARLSYRAIGGPPHCCASEDCVRGRHTRMVSAILHSRPTRSPAGRLEKEFAVCEPLDQGTRIESGTIVSPQWRRRTASFPSTAGK